MIKFDFDILKMRESISFEAKSARGGLPKSFFETYSSFANTIGGIVALGLEEKEAGLVQTGLTRLESEKLVKSLWDTLNSSKVNINLLKNDDVLIKEIDGSFIVLVNVPKANRLQKPIYLNENIMNSYKRSNEGDYKCTLLEIQGMLRDKEIKSADSYIANNFSLKVIKTETLDKYINMFKNVNSNSHPFLKDDIDTFLYRIGAADYDDEKQLKPTNAGVLMFADECDITKIFTNYILDYQDKRNITDQIENRYSNRIVSFKGDWSGNIYDFYFRVVNKIQEDIDVPFKLNGIFREENTNIQKAIREALCNTLVNADYFLKTGVVIKQYSDRIEFINAGELMLPIEKMIEGGTSSPRNSNIFKMFSLINIGERIGSGIPLIYDVSEKTNLQSPEIFNLINQQQSKLVIYLTNKLLEPRNINEVANGKEEKPNGKEEKPNGKEEVINKIVNLNISNKIKEKLLAIYNLVEYNSFTRKDLTKSNIAKSTQASSYIKILLDNDIIIKIDNNYKFK